MPHEFNGNGQKRKEKHQLKIQTIHNGIHRIAYYTIGLALLVGGIFSALWAMVLLGDLARYIFGESAFDGWALWLLMPFGLAALVLGWKAFFYICVRLDKALFKGGISAFLDDEGKKASKDY
jgi:hypothetical protein